jgi:L-lactate permease
MAEQETEEVVGVEDIQSGDNDAEKGFDDAIATDEIRGSNEGIDNEDNKEIPIEDIADNNNAPLVTSEIPRSLNVDLRKKRTDAPSNSVVVSNALFQSSIIADDLLGPRKSNGEGYIMEVILRTFPIWGTVLTLILTRIPVFKIKGILTSQTPYFGIHFGTYGDFRISASVVLQLKNILSYPNINWKYEVFYVPFLIPFVLVSLVTMLIYRKDMTCSARDIAGTVASRLKDPAIAIMGALVLVQLILIGGVESPANLLGSILAGWLRGGFVAISPLVGALGSFFSGSTTVSDLTFGEIQRIAATEIGISVNSMLALQAIGASAGNGICLNNIIAGLAVVGVNVSEGQILKRTAKFVFSLTTIATIVLLAIFIRF